MDYIILSFRLFQISSSSPIYIRGSTLGDAKLFSKEQFSQQLSSVLLWVGLQLLAEALEF